MPPSPGVTLDALLAAMTPVQTIAVMSTAPDAATVTQDYYCRTPARAIEVCQRLSARGFDVRVVMMPPSAVLLQACPEVVFVEDEP